MKRVLGKVLISIVLALTCSLLMGCSDTGEVSCYGGGTYDQGNEDSEGGRIESGGEGLGKASSGLEGENSGKISAQGLEYGEESRILLVERSTNFAWGHYDSGIFVDTEGKLYAYDFSRYPTVMRYDENALTYTQRLEIIREYGEGIALFDEEFVRSVLELGEYVSAEDEFEEKDVSFDRGQDTLYYYQPKTQELLMIKSEGDVDYTPKNKKAEKIAKMYDRYLKKLRNKLSESEIFTDRPTVYSKGDVTMMDFAAEDGSAWVGKWVVETKAQLKAFAVQSGIPVDDVLTGDNDPEYDAFNYLIFVEEAGQKEKGGNPRAIWIQGNCMDFVSMDGPGVEEGEFVFHLAEIRKEDLPLDGSAMMDLNGSTWKCFEKVGNAFGDGAKLK